MKYISYILFFYLLSFPLPGKRGLQKYEQEIDSIANAFFSPDKPGGTIIAVKNNKLIYLKSFGKADLELDVAMKPIHVTEIASNTKPFTAVAILKLAQEGLLSLDDSITVYFPQAPASWDNIYIKHLLSHTSGIYNYNDDMNAYSKIEQKEHTNEEMLNLFFDKPLNFIPGTQYRYSNSAYYLLGKIIEKVTGQSYGDYLKEAFFKPFKMNNTHLNTTKEIVKNRASGYETTKQGFINSRFVSSTFSASSTGGIISTVEDLYRWYKALLEHKIIDDTYLEQAAKPFQLSSNSFGRTGYGWFIGNLFGKKFLTHDGRSWGYVSSIIAIPDEEIFVAVLSNSSWYGYGSGVAYFPHKIAAVLMDKPYQIPIFKTENLLMYEGIYEASNGDKKTISLEGEQLFLVQMGGHLSPLFSQENDTFFVEDSYETIQFVTKNNVISSLISNKNSPISYNKTNKKLAKKSIYRAIRVTSLHNTNAALILYKTLKKENPDGYNFKDSSELNRLGYYLLSKGKVDSAIKIFKLLVSEFPKDANAYDSLGESYYHKKNYPMAYQNYQKSLQLNSNNKNAEAMIKKILKHKKNN